MSDDLLTAQQRMVQVVVRERLDVCGTVDRTTNVICIQSNGHAGRCFPNLNTKEDVERNWKEFQDSYDAFVRDNPAKDGLVWRIMGDNKLHQDLDREGDES